MELAEEAILGTLSPDEIASLVDQVKVQNYDDIMISRINSNGAHRFLDS